MKHLKQMETPFGGKVSVNFLVAKGCFVFFQLSRHLSQRLVFPAAGTGEGSAQGCVLTWGLPRAGRATGACFSSRKDGVTEWEQEDGVGLY